MEFVVCINNEGFESSLEINKIYKLASKENNMPKDYFSVIDESGESYIYEKNLFIPIEVKENLRKYLIAS